MGVVCTKRLDSMLAGARHAVRNDAEGWGKIEGEKKKGQGPRDDLAVEGLIDWLVSL